jgi:hypothetical protein
MKYIKYLSYILRHKWYVFIECMKLGIPWRGLSHDMSKFLPSEFFAYTNFFYGEKDQMAFDFAWHRHQKRNKHHWQWWILKYDSGKLIIFEMPLKYRKEMLADWRGCSMARTGTDDTANWYKENKDKMQLAPETRKWIESNI